MHERFTEHEAKQFEQDFIDCIGCAPEEYVRIRRAIRLLETRYPDSPNELTAAAVATPLGEMLAVFGSKGLCLLELVGQKHMEQEIMAVQKALRGQFIFQENEQTQLLRQELDLYFQGRLKVLAVGGSLGADVLNKTVPQALALLPEEARPQMYHQSGRNKLGNLQADYDALGVQAECVEFITDMVSAYRDADLVICRAGALTIAELTAAGLGCIVGAVSARSGRPPNSQCALYGAGRSWFAATANSTDSRKTGRNPRRLEP